jgi:hypothetical protein
MEKSAITSEYGLVSPKPFPMEERLRREEFRGQKKLIAEGRSVAVGKAAM